MVATVYAKWINGQADQAEMAKLNTRALPTTIESEGAKKNLGIEKCEKNEKNLHANDEKNRIAETEKQGVGRELGEKNLRCSQVLEFKKK